MQESKRLLDWYRHDTSMLQRLVFLDETSVFSHGNSHDHVHVWAMRDDPGFEDVCHVPRYKLNKPNKAHIIAAVTAHPAFASRNGLLYMDFTIGTTDIHRRHNKRMDGSQASHNFVYLVSVLPGGNITDVMTVIGVR